MIREPAAAATRNFDRAPAAFQPGRSVRMMIPDSRLMLQAPIRAPANLHARILVQPERRCSKLSDFYPL
jgi:hypothetical protein